MWLPVPKCSRTSHALLLFFPPIATILATYAPDALVKSGFYNMATEVGIALHSQDSSASHDFVHYDSDPTPDYDADEPNTHGTECAGVVGMSTNNYCGVGVAHDANIGCESHLPGILAELCALNFHEQH